MALERQHDINELYTLYDGRRPEEEASSVKKVDLGLNKMDLLKLVSTDTDKVVSACDSMKYGDSGNRTFGHKFKYGEMRELFGATLPSDPSISFHVSKDLWTRRKSTGPETGTYPPPGLRPDGQSVVFELHKAVDGPEKFIGNYRLDSQDGDWSLNERFINEKYRDHGIGSVLFTATENFVQAYADVHGPQKMIANTGQPRVLVMFLNRGFQAATPDDQRRIDRVLSGDESLELDYADLYDEVWEEGRVVGHEWKKQNYKDPYCFEKGLERKTEQAALRINLVKSFEPRETAVDRVGGDVGERAKVVTGS